VTLHGDLGKFKLFKKVSVIFFFFFLGGGGVLIMSVGDFK
jgi:hypothetical protein